MGPQPGELCGGPQHPRAMDQEAQSLRGGRPRNHLRLAEHLRVARAGETGRRVHLYGRPLAAQQTGQFALRVAAVPHRAGRQLCAGVARPVGPGPYCTVITAYEFEDIAPIVITTILSPDGVPGGTVMFTW